MFELPHVDGHPQAPVAVAPVIAEEPMKSKFDAYQIPPPGQCPECGERWARCRCTEEDEAPCTSCGEVVCTCDSAEGDEEDEDADSRELWLDHRFGRGNW